MSAVESGKLCAAAVWRKAIILFLGAGAIDLFINRNSMDALVGSLVGLACLLAITCACGFAYGYITDATTMSASVEKPVPMTQPAVRQPQPAPKKAASDTWAWLIVGLLFWFWRSGFSFAAMPSTATAFLRSVYLGFTKLLGT